MVLEFIIAGTLIFAPAIETAVQQRMSYIAPEIYQIAKVEKRSIKYNNEPSITASKTQQQEGQDIKFNGYPKEFIGYFKILAEGNTEKLGEIFEEFYNYIKYWDWDKQTIEARIISSAGMAKVYEMNAKYFEDKNKTFERDENYYQTISHYLALVRYTESVKKGPSILPDIIAYLAVRGITDNKHTSLDNAVEDYKGLLNKLEESKVEGEEKINAYIVYAILNMERDIRAASNDTEKSKINFTDIIPKDQLKKLYKKWQLCRLPGFLLKDLKECLGKK